MLKRLLLIVIIMSVLILIQGCTSISEFYHCRIYSKETQKRDFIINLIKNPNQYDSILHNSEFYHPEYSQFLDDDKKDIILHFKNINSDNFEPYIDEEFRHEIKEKYIIHDIAYLFDRNNIDFNKNVISVYYILHNSEWFIIDITLGNYRIEQLE